mgnify:CR=1 FL=1
MATTKTARPSSRKLVTAAIVDSTNGADHGAGCGCGAHGGEGRKAVAVAPEA